MREYKKRILFIDINNAFKVGGSSTFIEEFLKVLDENDIVGDFVNYTMDPATVDRFKAQYENINEVIELKTEMPVLHKEKNNFEQKKAFYGTYVHNPMTEYMFIKKMHELMNTYIYDYIFVNNSELIPLVTNTFPFSKMMRIIVYTHCSHLFSYFTIFKGNFDDVMTQYVVSSLQNDENCDIIEQKRNDFVTNTFPNHNRRKIPLSLDVTKFHEHQIPEDEKEDSVLYLGRAHNTSKNFKGWCKLIAQAGVHGVAIVPTKKGAETIKKEMALYDYNDYEVHYNLTFAEKMLISSKCKVCFVTSNMETFSYVIYENSNLMKIVVLEKDWSLELKDSLPFIELTTEKDSAKVLKNALKTYSNDAVKEQHEFLLEFNANATELWGEYFSEPNRFDDVKKKTTKTIEALETVNTLPLALKHMKKDELCFDELLIMYRNLDRSKVIHHRDATYYGQVPKTEDAPKTSLDELF